MKPFREIVALILMLIGLPLATYYEGFHNASRKRDERYFKTCYPALLDFRTYKGKLYRRGDLPESANSQRMFKPSGFRYGGDWEMWRKKVMK